VFCRNGCHFSMVASEHDYHSCPACNSQMTATAEDAYMDALVNAGNVQ
jgi:Zn finger protein HypA/HybF involved in hydrogenase expression